MADTLRLLSESPSPLRATPGMNSATWFWTPPGDISTTLSLPRRFAYTTTSSRFSRSREDAPRYLRESACRPPDPPLGLSRDSSDRQPHYPSNRNTFGSDASDPWQTVWWALIDPHRRVSAGLRRAMRLRMLARSPAEDRVFI